MIAENENQSSDSLTDDYARCESCANHESYYKRACVSCDGSSNFILSNKISKQKEILSNA